MSNLSYCRFENTLRDLIVCQDALEHSTHEQLKALSETESHAMTRLIEVCGEIYHVFSDDPEGCPYPSAE